MDTIPPESAPTGPRARRGGVRRVLKWAWFLLGLPTVFLTFGALLGAMSMLATDRSPWTPARPSS